MVHLRAKGMDIKFYKDSVPVCLNCRRANTGMFKLATNTYRKNLTVAGAADISGLN